MKAWLQSAPRSLVLMSGVAVLSIVTASLLAASIAVWVQIVAAVLAVAAEWMLRRRAEEKARESRLAALEAIAGRCMRAVCLLDRHARQGDFTPRRFVYVRDEVQDAADSVMRLDPMSFGSKELCDWIFGLQRNMRTCLRRLREAEETIQALGQPPASLVKDIVGRVEAAEKRLLSV